MENENNTPIEIFDHIWRWERELFLIEYMIFRCQDEDYSELGQLAPRSPNLTTEVTDSFSDEMWESQLLELSRARTITTTNLSQNEPVLRVMDESYAQEEQENISYNLQCPSIENKFHSLKPKKPKVRQNKRGTNNKKHHSQNHRQAKKLQLDDKKFML